MDTRRVTVDYLYFNDYENTKGARKKHAFLADASAKGEGGESIKFFRRFWKKRICKNIVNLFARVSVKKLI